MSYVKMLPNLRRNMNFSRNKTNVINTNYISRSRWPNNARFSRLRYAIKCEDTMEGKVTRTISSNFYFKFIDNELVSYSCRVTHFVTCAVRHECGSRLVG